MEDALSSLLTPVARAWLEKEEFDLGDIVEYEGDSLDACNHTLAVEAHVDVRLSLWEHHARRHDPEFITFADELLEEQRGQGAFERDPEQKLSDLKAWDARTPADIMLRITPGYLVFEPRPWAYSAAFSFAYKHRRSGPLPYPRSAMEADWLEDFFQRRCVATLSLYMRGPQRVAALEAWYAKHGRRLKRSDAFVAPEYRWSERAALSWLGQYRAGKLRVRDTSLSPRLQTLFEQCLAPEYRRLKTSERVEIAQRWHEANEPSIHLKLVPGGSHAIACERTGWPLQNMCVWLRYSCSRGRNPLEDEAARAQVDAIVAARMPGWSPSSTPRLTLDEKIAGLEEWDSRSPDGMLLTWDNLDDEVLPGWKVASAHKWMYDVLHGGDNSIDDADLRARFDSIRLRRFKAARLSYAMDRDAKFAALDYWAARQPDINPKLKSRGHDNFVSREHCWSEAHAYSFIQAIASNPEDPDYGRACSYRDRYVLIERMTRRLEDETWCTLIIDWDRRAPSGMRMSQYDYNLLDTETGMTIASARAFMYRCLEAGRQLQVSDPSTTLAQLRRVFNERCRHRGIRCAHCRRHMRARTLQRACA